jgi:hypothetical protein
MSGDRPSKPWRSIRFWITVALALRLASPLLFEAWHQALLSRTLSEWGAAGGMVLVAALIVVAVPLAIRWLGRW